MQSKTWLSLAAAVIALGLTAAKQLPPPETGSTVLPAAEGVSFGDLGTLGVSTPTTFSGAQKPEQIGEQTARPRALIPTSSGASP